MADKVRVWLVQLRSRSILRYWLWMLIVYTVLRVRLLIPSMTRVYYGNHWLLMTLILLLLVYYLVTILRISHRNLPINHGLESMRLLIIEERLMLALYMHLGGWGCLVNSLEGVHALGSRGFVPYCLHELSLSHLVQTCRSLTTIIEFCRHLIIGHGRFLIVLIMM